MPVISFTDDEAKELIGILTYQFENLCEAVDNAEEGEEEPETIQDLKTERDRIGNILLKFGAPLPYEPEEGN